MTEKREKTGMGTSENPVADSHFESVDTDVVNNVEWAASGSEIQTKINNVAPGGKVELYGKDSMTVSSEIYVKDGITLDFNGVTLKPDSDVNVLFIDHNATVRDLDIDTTGVTGYSSNAIEVDSGRAGDAYTTNKGNDIDIQGRVTDGNQNGTGLYLHATSSGSIAHGNRIELAISGMDTAVDAHSESTWINDHRYYFEITHCVKGIVHRGDSPFKTLIQGQLQPASGTSNVGIDNQTTQESCFWLGPTPDTSDWGTNFIQGPNVRVLPFSNQGTVLEGQTDGSGSVLSFEMNGDTFRKTNAGEGLKAEEILESGSNWAFYLNGTRAMRLNTVNSNLLMEQYGIDLGGSDLLDLDTLRFNSGPGFIVDQSNGIQFKGDTGNYTYTGSDETGDGMTADPETATEDGFIQIDIGSNSYQIPIYDG